MHDKTLQNLNVKLQSMQETMQKNQQGLMTMPLVDWIMKMKENMKLLVKVNKLWDEQQTIVRRLEPLQKEVL